MAVTFFEESFAPMDLKFPHMTWLKISVWDEGLGRPPDRPPGRHPGAKEAHESGGFTHLNSTGLVFGFHFFRKIVRPHGFEISTPDLAQELGLGRPYGTATRRPTRRPYATAPRDGPTRRPHATAPRDGPTRRPYATAPRDGLRDVPRRRALSDGPTRRPNATAPRDGPT